MINTRWPLRKDDVYTPHKYSEVLEVRVELFMQIRTQKAAIEKFQSRIELDKK